MERCLRNHLSNLEGNWQPQSQKMAIFYIPSCQTEVGGHIVYVKGIHMTPLLETLLVYVSKIQLKVLQLSVLSENLA